MKEYFASIHQLFNVAGQIALNCDIVIVPNSKYLQAFKKLVPSNFNANFVTFEGIDLAGLIPSLNIDIISRNQVYALIVEIIKKKHIIELSEKDASVFARAIIGELPSICASGLTPEKILNKIPATISTQKEININAFVGIWREFDLLCKKLKKAPYYFQQEFLLNELLKHCVQNGKKVLIIGDGGRAKIYNNFIENVIKSNIDAKILEHLTQNSEIEKINHTKIDVQTITESEEVCEIVKYAVAKNFHKIGIVSVDETLNKGICGEMQKNGIKASLNIGKSAVASPLIRILLFIIDGNIKEVFPLLKIDVKEKAGILNEIVNGEFAQCVIWQEIKNIANQRDEIVIKAKRIYDFLKQNIHFFYSNEKDLQSLDEFVVVFTKEAEKLELLDIKIDFGFFRHFITSWKIWNDENDDGEIDIISVEHAYLNKYDCIILTSQTKAEQGGNVIFSNGLRKFFSFASEDLHAKMLQLINAEIFIGKSCEYFAHTPASTVELKIESKYAVRRKSASVTIDDVDLQKISASAFECLVESAEKFYYRYVRCLRGVVYNERENLSIGTILHKVLEIATQNVAYAKKELFRLFQNYKGMDIFYEKSLNFLIDDIQKKKAESWKIETEKEFAIEVGNFTLTAKCDRVDTLGTNSIIWDYKSGSSLKFTKSAITKNFQKIQLYIPAIKLDKACNVIAKYYFLQNKDNKEVVTIMTEALMTDFKEFANDILGKFLTQGEEIILEQNYYKF